MAEKILDIINLPKKKFDEFVTISKMNNTNHLEQYFSKEILNILLPITTDNKEFQDTLERIIKELEQSPPNEKTFSIELGSPEGRSIHGKKAFILKKEGISGFDIDESSKVNPHFIAKEDNRFDVEIGVRHIAHKRVYYNKELLNNPYANHSVLIAHLNECLAYLANYKKIDKYSVEQGQYISWLLATYMCKEGIEKGFPVLEGFTSTEQFANFANLNIIKTTGNKLDTSNLLSRDEINKILTAHAQ